MAKTAKLLDDTKHLNDAGNPLDVWHVTPPAHQRPENLDPHIHGPFLDDIRNEQEKAYRQRRGVKVTKSNGKSNTVMREDGDVARDVEAKILEFAPPKLRPPTPEETPENHSEDVAIRDPRLGSKVRDAGSANKLKFPKDKQFIATEKVGVDDDGKLIEKRVIKKSLSKSRVVGNAPQVRKSAAKKSSKKPARKSVAAAKKATAKRTSTRKSAGKKK